MASEYTSHYNLDLYADSDKPNLRDQYNGAMNKVDQQLYKQSVDTTTANSNANNAVAAADAASKAAADEAARAKAAEDAIRTTADAAGKAASDEATRAEAAESAITDAYKAADTKLSDDITAAYKAADTKLSADITAAYKAADTSLSNTITTAYESADTKLSADITAAYKAADSELAAHFPIRTADIAAGAVTRDKLDAQALSSLIQGITIRRFDSTDNNADNTGLIVPNSNCKLSGFYLPELTMLVITDFSLPAGQACGSYFDGTTQFRLPSYIPHTTAGIVKLGSVAIKYTSSNDFVNWTEFGLNRNGYVGVSSEYSTEGVSLKLAGNVVVFLRGYGVA